MQIPSYQIDNVLKVYSKQVSRGKILERQKSLNNVSKPSADKITISSEGKRESIINKVAADIVERITNYGPQNDIDRNITEQLEKELGGKLTYGKEGSGQFVYNAIDENNQKTQNTLSVEDTDFVTKRLEEIAKETVNNNMAS